MFLSLIVVFALAYASPVPAGEGPKIGTRNPHLQTIHENAVPIFRTPFGPNFQDTFGPDRRRDQSIAEPANRLSMAEKFQIDRQKWPDGGLEQSNADLANTKEQASAQTPPKLSIAEKLEIGRQKWAALSNTNEKVGVSAGILLIGSLLCSIGGENFLNLIYEGGELGGLANCLSSFEFPLRPGTETWELGRKVGANSALVWWTLYFGEMNIKGFSQDAASDSCWRSESVFVVQLNKLLPMIECVVASTAACYESGDPLIKGCVSGICLGTARVINVQLEESFKLDHKNWDLWAIEQFQFALTRIFGAALAAQALGQEDMIGPMILGLLYAGSLVGVTPK